METHETWGLTLALQPRGFAIPGYQSEHLMQWFGILGALPILLQGVMGDVEPASGSLAPRGCELPLLLLWLLFPALQKHADSSSTAAGCYQTR